MRPTPMLCKVIAAMTAWWLALSLHAQPAPADAETTRLAIAAGTTADAQAAGGSIAFIGTATVLIRYQGLSILTDPNFLHKGEHVYLGYGVRAERLTDPALALSQLPPIDLVILSHLHEDHFDRRVQEQLNRDTPIVSTREAASQLRRIGFRRALGLSTWDRLEVSKGQARLLVTAMPGRHGVPGVSILLPTVMGSMLDFSATAAQPKYRMYISGDTTVFDDLALIAQRFPGIDMALLHLGGTRLLNLARVTMDAKDGVAMLKLIGPERAIPIHYNDYDVFKSPLAEFEAQARAAGLEKKIIYLKHGDSVNFGNSATPPGADSGK